MGLARIIISAKSLVEGFNVPSADLGVIAASSSSVRQRIQSLGRMLRRKPGGRGARIVVLYVRDSEDEAIYERADWEGVIGAERNRYFHWVDEAAPGGWTSGLSEMDKPPRAYLPPSSDVAVSELALGSPYPGRPQGLDLRVDDARNLRTQDGHVVPASTQQVEAILLYSAARRARRTPAGHLIVRGEPSPDAPDGWRYLGELALPDATAGAEVRRLRVRTSSGRRELALEESRHAGHVRFALSASRGGSRAASDARDSLLAWIASLESGRSIVVRELCWDGGETYWVELSGERVEHPRPLAALEFAT